MGRVNETHKEMQEVWESFEWLFREKLESLDNMTRKMITEMTACKVNMDEIRHFLPQAFAQLWERVAKEQEEKA